MANQAIAILGAAGTVRGLAGGATGATVEGATAGIEARLAAGAVKDLNGLTKAGRALEKHGSRPGSNFPQARGGVAAKNAQGQEILEGILRSDCQTIKPNRFGGQDIFDNNALRGARFDGNGDFMGFLEP
ncbi:MAG: hypothetical protein AB7O68_21365 [Pirellulales bacterium]